MLFRSGQGCWGKENRVGAQGCGGGGGAGGGGSAPPPVYVEEYDRQELNLRRSQVKSEPPRTQLHLDTLDKVPMATARCRFFCFLQATIQVLLSFKKKTFKISYCRCVWFLS